MDTEAKCDCQRCGNPLAFPVDMHNQDIECPHCHKQTTLLVPSPENRVKALPIEPSPRTESQSSTAGLETAGYACAVLLPMVGFIIGIILLAKERTNSGLVAIILSILFGFIWSGVFMAIFG